MSVDDFRWVLLSGLEDAGCVTVVPGGDVAQVLAAFGAVDASARPAASVDDVGDRHADVVQPICVVELPDAVVVLEDNGFQGSRPEVLGPASRAGTASVASSFFWNVNAVTAFSAARRGRLLFSVELIGAADDDLGGVPKALRPHVVAAEQDDLVPAGLDLVRRWTRVDLARAAGAAGAAGTVYDTEPPPSRLLTYLPGHGHVLGLDDAPHLLAAMTADQQRAVARWATRVAAREASVSDEPTVARARAAQARAELFDRLRDLQDTGEDLPPHPFRRLVVDDGWGGELVVLSEVERLHVGQQSMAVRAWQHVVHPDAYSAAVACLDAASLCCSMGRLDRGWTFDEDDRMRRRAGTTPNPRHEAFVDVASRFLAELPGDPDDAAARADAGLPSPLGQDEKDAAVRADLEASARGDFVEWQRA
ncbi:hypothetical protein KDN32_11670 [Nocardioides sp. J2M5]|uniref:DUF6461 domain-containing protein n=1 Tax=Nocardioides palaemonis TaxID=2829810 RepID=UPI001BABEB0D|nr:DUF6461 domain-containing protein [Nocardioides palaemonis]MBS2938401.1 hypothetical protein [Nocardioides palaemonis]